MTTTGFGRRYAATFDDLQDARKLAGGLAAADYHGGGDADLYVVGGDTDPNHLYGNRGDGTFVEVASTVALDLMHLGSGPALGDIDGDLVLFVGAVEGTRYDLLVTATGPSSTSTSGRASGWARRTPSPRRSTTTTGMPTWISSSATGAWRVGRATIRKPLAEQRRRHLWRRRG